MAKETSSNKSVYRSSVTSKYWIQFSLSSRGARCLISYVPVVAGFNLSSLAFLSYWLTCVYCATRLPQELGFITFSPCRNISVAGWYRVILQSCILLVTRLVCSVLVTFIRYVPEDCSSGGCDAVCSDRSVLTPSLYQCTLLSLGPIRRGSYNKTQTLGNIIFF